MRGKRMSTGEGGYQKVPVNRAGGGRGSINGESISGESMLEGTGSDSGMSSHPQSPAQARGRALSRAGPGPPGTVLGGNQNGGMLPVGTPVMLVKDVPVIQEEGKEKEGDSAVRLERKGKDGEKVIADAKRKSVVVEKPPPRSPTPPVVAAATEEAAAAQGVWGKGGV